jgi:hypothetical protein
MSAELHATVAVTPEKETSVRIGQDSGCAPETAARAW